MGLPIYVDFAQFTKSGGPLSAHLHIGRRSSVLLPRQPVLLDKGITRCPVEIDLAYSEIASHLIDEGPGADVFIEPLSPNTDIRLDVFLERTAALPDHEHDERDGGGDTRQSTAENHLGDESLRPALHVGPLDAGEQHGGDVGT